MPGRQHCADTNDQLGVRKPQREATAFPARAQGRAASPQDSAIPPGCAAPPLQGAGSGISLTLAAAGGAGLDDEGSLGQPRRGRFARAGPRRIKARPPGSAQTVVAMMPISVMPTGMAAVPATTSDHVKRRCGEADGHEKNSAPASAWGRSHGDFLAHTVKARSKQACLSAPATSPPGYADARRNSADRR